MCAENVLDGTKCVVKGILYSLKRLFGTNDHGTSKAHRGRGDVLMRLAQEDSLVRKNARFAHDMMNCGCDVRGKRFRWYRWHLLRRFVPRKRFRWYKVVAYGAGGGWPRSGEPPLPLGELHWSMFGRAKMKKAPRKTEVLFLEWEQRESNPRPSACKADALNQLSYAPKRFFNLWLLNQDLNLGPSD